MTEREKVIAGLRHLAQMLAMNPELKAPTYISIYVPIEASEIRKTAKALKSFKKDYGTTDFGMIKTFGPSMTVQWFTNREAVCKKVVVGHKEIPEMIIAAKPEQVVPASDEKVIPAHTEEITEWVCSDAALMEEEAPVVQHQAEAMEMPF